MNISVPHNLSQEEALNRVKGLLNKLKEEQAGRFTNLSEDWRDNGGNFQITIQGFDLGGEIAVTPSAVDINAKLPFALSLFQGAIKQTITGKLNELLTA